MHPYLPTYISDPLTHVGISTHANHPLTWGTYTQGTHSRTWGPYTQGTHRHTWGPRVMRSGLHVMPSETVAADDELPLAVADASRTAISCMLRSKPAGALGVSSAIVACNSKSNRT